MPGTEGARRSSGGKGEPGRARRASSPAPRLTGSILVVEDNRDLCDLYVAYFVRRGFRAHGVSDGQEALVVLMDDLPDIVVTDLTLPHIDGWELTRRLKENPRTAHIPVLACTGNALGTQVERALLAGCDGYIVKPCLPEDLLYEVHRLLGRRAA
jgi:CheY-like chemotaxis protein